MGRRGGGSKQLKIPPGGGFGRGCKIAYICFWRGAGNLQTPRATPLCGDGGGVVVVMWWWCGDGGGVVVVVWGWWWCGG